MKGNKVKPVGSEKIKFDGNQHAHSKLLNLLLFLVVFVGNYLFNSSKYPLENGIESLTSLIVVTGIYLVPFYVAEGRKHRDMLAIFVLNLLLGWTFVGWVAALVWALTNQKKE